MKYRPFYPRVTVYSSEEVAELLGPVQTQYAPPPPPCGCFSPDNILEYKAEFEQDLTVSVDTSRACGKFEQVKIEIYDGSNLEFGPAILEYPSGGTQNGDRWEVKLDSFFTVQDPPRRYDLTVSFLMNGAVKGKVCRSSFIADPDTLP